MKTLTFLCSLTFSLLILNFPANADSIIAIRMQLDQVKGVKAPGKILEYARPDLKSASPEQPSLQRCHVFPNFVAVEIDTSQVGAEQIILRARKKTDKLAGLCKSKKATGEIPLKIEEQYVLGAAGNYLFTRSADGAGEESGLWIYDAVTGKQLYEASYHEHQDFLAKLEGDLLSLDYYHRLNAPCDLSLEKSNCWEKTLAANKVPASVKLPWPDCSKVFQSEDFQKHPELKHEPRAIQLFTHVVVDDVRKPERRYLQGAVLCNAAP